MVLTNCYVRRQLKSEKLTTVTFMKKMRNMFFCSTTARSPSFCLGQRKNFFPWNDTRKNLVNILRITMYLYTAQDFYRSESVNLVWGDTSDNDDNNSAITAENIAPAKRFKEDPDSISNEQCKKLSTKLFALGDQITTQIGETGHVNLELEAGEKSHDVDKDDEGESGEKQNFTTLPEVVQALEKRVDRGKEFFTTVRWKTPLQRILRLWQYELKKQGAHHQIKIRFLGGEGMDSGA
ncbi:hypothetical protein AWC38_SpisGene5941 [Stylophora pistillata]|uniref:Uncharacterized protein n=1 Tax=Stylophora pistillata TaxID=50429 RepID=A0A2B4SL47_STYPI|nr:hypothetical protein AWC38_SpisGene5941 [Stylophora pistillata]